MALSKLESELSELYECPLCSTLFDGDVRRPIPCQHGHLSCLDCINQYRQALYHPTDDTPTDPTNCEFCTTCRKALVSKRPTSLNSIKMIEQACDLTNRYVNLSRRKITRLKNIIKEQNKVLKRKTKKLNRKEKKIKWLLNELNTQHDEIVTPVLNPANRSVLVCAPEAPSGFIVPLPIANPTPYNQLIPIKVDSLTLSSLYTPSVTSATHQDSTNHSVVPPDSPSHEGNSPAVSSNSPTHPGESREVANPVVSPNINSPASPDIDDREVANPVVSPEIDSPASPDIDESQGFVIDAESEGRSRCLNMFFFLPTKHLFPKTPLILLLTRMI